MKWLLGLAGIAWGTFVSRSVWADDVKQVAQVPTARVWLQAPSTRSFQIQGLVNRQPLALCQGECLVELPLGSYWVTIPASEGDAAGTTRLEVSGSKRYRLIDPDRSAANGGRAMGIVGIVLVPIAGVLFLTSGVLCVDNCGSPSSLWRKSPVARSVGRAHLRRRLTLQIAAVFSGFAPSICNPPHRRGARSDLRHRLLAQASLDWLGCHCCRSLREPCSRR